MSVSHYFERAKQGQLKRLLRDATQWGGGVVTLKLSRGSKEGRLKLVVKTVSCSDHECATEAYVEGTAGGKEVTATVKADGTAAVTGSEPFAHTKVRVARGSGRNRVTESYSL